MNLDIYFICRLLILNHLFFTRVPSSGALFVVVVCFPLISWPTCKTSRVSRVSCGSALFSLVQTLFLDLVDFEDVKVERCGEAIVVEVEKRMWFDGEVMLLGRARK